MSVKLQRPPRGKDPADWSDWTEQVEQQLMLVGSRTIDVGNITAGTVSTFTVTVTGCKVNQGQSVVLSPPSAIEANLVWCGVVTANDTVTVRLYNPTGGGINPASGLWGARVFL